MSTRSPRVGLFLRGGSYAYQDEIAVGAHLECSARGVDLYCLSGGNITTDDPRNFVYALPGPGDLDAGIFVTGTMGAGDGDPRVDAMMERLRPLPMCVIGPPEPGIPCVAIDNYERRPRADPTPDRETRPAADRVRDRPRPRGRTSPGRVSRRTPGPRPDRRRQPGHPGRLPVLGGPGRGGDAAGRAPAAATPSSRRTTGWRWARSTPCTRAACAFPKTSRWSGSTTSRRRASPRHR